MSELPLEAYYDLTQVGEIAVSPDGDRVAFTTTEYDEGADESVGSLFVAPADGSRNPHRLTRVDGAGSPAWGPDGDRLAFIAARDEDTKRRVGRNRGESDDDPGDDEASDDDPSDDEPDDGDGPTPQVWLFDLGLGGDARQVTDREDGVSEFDWSPDGDRIVVAADDPTDAQREYRDARKEGGPIETTRLQHKLDGVGWTDEVRPYLFVVDVETGTERRLDDAYGGGAFQGLAGMEPDWGPEGYIAFTSCRLENPDDTTVRDVYAIDPDGSVDEIDGSVDETTDEMVDEATDETVDEATEATADEATEATADETEATGANERDGPEAVRLTDGELGCSTPTWRGDGTLGFVAGHPENWSRPDELFVGNAFGGDDPAESDPDPEAVFASVTGELDRTVARGGGVDWVGDAVLSTIADHSRTRLVRATADGDVARLFEAQGDERAVAGVDVAADGSTVAVVLSDPTDGADVFTLDTAELVDLSTDSAAGDPYDPIAVTADGAPGSFPDEPESFTRVSATNDDLIETYPMPEVERVAWESEGWELDGVLYHDPEVDPMEGPHPLVVAIHGGPISYDEPVFSFAHAALTSRGYVVFRPNYRGGSSRGRAFSEELRGVWGTAEVTDITAGVESLVDRGVADPDRVFGYGFSYGGIAQGFLVTQEPDLFTAAAPEHGIYDLRSAFGTDDTHVWIENEYGLPWEEPEAFDASSAILDAGAIETPLLVMAGGNDWRCPPTQSEQLYVAAKKSDVDAKLVVYPEEHHNIGDPDRAIHRLESILDWYETHDPAIDDGDADGGDAVDEATDGDADGGGDTGADGDTDANDDRRHD